MSQKMDKKLFKKLGKAPNARGSWRFVRDVVASELIGDQIFPMPYIQDGPHYKLGDFILKEKRTKGERILGKTPAAIRAGQLKGFIEPFEDVSENEDMLTIFKNCFEYRDACFNPKYVFYKETTRKGTKKSILVEVDRCKEIGLTHIPAEEDELSVLFAERGLDVTKFYYVSTIYHAQKVRIVVKINDQTDEYVTSSPDWTIGFKLHKYKVDDYGDIGPHEKQFPKKLKMRIVPWCIFRGFRT